MHKSFVLLAALSAFLSPVMAATGDKKCFQDMCIAGVVNDNSTTTYTLTVNKPKVGWMAMGFGRSMLSSAMVILWTDPSSGQVVVSQRAADRYAEPQVVASPPRVASALNYATSVASTSTTLAFSVPSNSDTIQDLIWAWSSVAPQGSGPGATLTEHDDMGPTFLNLSIPITGFTDTPQTSVGDNLPPLTTNQRMILAHGVILAIAFLVILPIGALQARLLRTFIPGKVWFTTHWVFQWPLSGALIATGFALGVGEVQNVHKKHFVGKHESLGLALVILYVLQCTYGGIIHFFKSAKATRRPPQNYGHAILGITIITLGFYQVYLGIHQQWETLGRGAPSRSISTFWTVWAVIIPVVYLLGLALLPRQYRMERKAREDRVVMVSYPLQSRSMMTAEYRTA